MGVAAAQGLIASESFYWGRDAASRAWTARWTSQLPGKVPNMFQAYAYTAALHCLRAVQAAGTDDGPTIVAAMKRMPVDDSTTMRQPHRPADVAPCKLAAG
jgi:branched-chain amino acid transport system substrate-binding protein